ncbi:hypothetical protein ACI2JM_11115 [Psychrobacter sp. NPDC064578]|uniref:hypothetical protein n=1 Tax=Psychrobacter sp. NPDC064578 TaxID=3364493 RepID=UPI00384B283C
MSASIQCKEINNLKIHLLDNDFDSKPLENGEKFVSDKLNVNIYNNGNVMFQNTIGNEQRIDNIKSYITSLNSK